MLHMVENCCSTLYLDMIRVAAINSRGWHFKYPIGMSFEDKHPKMDVIENKPIDEVISGMVMGLLIQIYDKCDKDLFYPEVSYCGISVKDRYRLDNMHVDHEHDLDYIKIVGLLNNNWNSKDGGALIYGDETVDLSPTNFVVMDPRVLHAASKITTNEKRIAIDFTVKKK